AVLALQRHATSKIQNMDDLEALHTLGFRGEALPSIAAVAELELVSAIDDDGVGARLALRDGKVIVEAAAPRGRGTTVTARHLFHNVPARLAASDRVQGEVAQIAQTVRRLALAAPTVRFTLHAEGRLAVETSGSGDLATTLAEVYGDGISESLLPVGPVEVAGARLSGIVGGPELTRPGRGAVNLVVNGRWVQPRGLLGAIETAYRPVLPRGRHPVLVFLIETAPERVDINLHPSKLEVRLLAERAIGMALGELVRDALGRRPLTMKFQPEIGLAALNVRPAGVAEERLPYDDEAPIMTPGLPPLRLVGQLQNRLLLLEGPTALYLVDQHRAHERIIFERLLARYGRVDTEVVPLPEPLLLELRPAQIARFGRRLDELAAFGFECEVFGGRTFLLRTTPVLPGVIGGDDASPHPLDGLGLADEIGATLRDLTGGDTDEGAEGESWRERLLVQLSCRTAVRRGRPLQRAAMRALVEGLGESSAPAVCPHGSPLLMHVGGDLLERQFGWR
ncbi:MAG: DNA mismatch repair endonuclease MutL, partial [Chloroflexota bacterium]|nr:DNA mismatch repair endonuclease MutL [Chloroflexota bacterium]